MIWLVNRLPRKVLLVAYEFPPSSSPGALRWGYLAREIAAQGHIVEVLVPRLAGSDSFDVGGVTVHTSFAGPLCGVTAWLARIRSRQNRPRAAPEGGEAPQVQLNWKGRFVEQLNRVAGRFLYPDIRAEWRPWARRALRRLLDRAKPDVVISAHEPATTLEIGILASRRDIPWIIDLGDPVLAPYTPKRWERRALAVERESCLAAAHVIVTTAAAKRLLVDRHSVAPERISVISQGFDDRVSPGASAASQIGFDPGLVELLYVGRFYPFRRPDQLIAAVLCTEGVRLTIVSPNTPAEFLSLPETHVGKVRLVGAVQHAQALAMQREADVLVNIGNNLLSTQVPGKLFEYLGADKPILHLLADGGAEPDPSGELLRELEVGWVCNNSESDIATLLASMQAMKRSGTLHSFRTAQKAEVARYGWSALGTRYCDLIDACIKTGTNG